MWTRIGVKTAVNAMPASVFFSEVARDLYSVNLAGWASDTGEASTSLIQRHLRICYNRAATLIEQMEKEGIVSPANHVGRREVLCRVTRDDDD